MSISHSTLFVIAVMLAPHAWPDDLPSTAGARADALTFHAGGTEPQRENAHPCHPSNPSTPDVTTVELVLNGIPAILRIPKLETKAAIILWHGLGTPGSPLELMLALPLDQVPALKIYLSLPLTGSRAPVEPADSLANRQAQDFATRLFQPIVLGAATELQSAIQALEQLGCLAQRENIGLFGFSAGGTAALIALADGNAGISAVVTLNAPTGLTDNVQALERATGTRYPWTSAARDLRQRADVILKVRAIVSGSAPPALLQIHGARDPIVASGGSRALYDALRPVYGHAGYPDRVKLLDSIDATHNWTEGPAREDIEMAVAAWFLKFLPDQVKVQ
jgi:predicted esterase